MSINQVAPPRNRENQSVVLPRSFRTPKGTELPLLSLRGREYLEVKYRLVWFREEHSDWAIETELLSVTDQSACARATIKDEKGRVIATSHKFESQKGFPDFIEKAETGAIGRALALIGFGTQFCADELDEGARLVDAPVRNRNAPGSNNEKEEGLTDGSDGGRFTEFEINASSMSDGQSTEERQAKIDPGEYVINFGRKFKGHKLKDIARKDLEGYVEWLEENAIQKGIPLSEEAHRLKSAVQRYFSVLQ